jgi:RNA polymerase sigma-70 factor (ECF subfamily)
MDTILTAPPLGRVAVDPIAVDPAALFAGLIERELDRSYRLATVILGDALEAEDAVHDAAVSAWAGFRGLRDPARFEPWFSRILINGCRDRLRRRKRTPVVDVSALIDLVRDDRHGSDVAGVSADRDAVSRALARLEPEHQVALVLRFWLDLPVDAIADRLGIPAGTVKSRLHNGLRRLREILEDGGPRR